MRNLRDTAWRTALLLLGLAFHLVLYSASQAEVAGVGFSGFPATLIEGLPFAGYAVAALASILLLAAGRFRVGAVAGVAAALLMLPANMLTFPTHWQLGLTGILFTLLQARYLMRPRREREEELAAGMGGRLFLAGADWGDLMLLATAALLVTVLLARGYNLLVTPVALAAAWWVIGMAFLVSLVFELEHYPPSRRTGSLLPYLLLLLVLVFALAPALRYYFPVALAVRQVVVAAVVWLHKRGGHELWYYMTNRPGSLLVTSFAAAILIGALLLSLPAASAGPKGLSTIDAFFTATSATCVTGLIVVDTGSDLTLFGQIVVLVLIQAGGLGIMTISTFIALLLGRNIGLRGEFAVKEVIGEQRARAAVRLVKFIVLSTVLVEGLGALLLAWNFAGRGVPLWQSLYWGVFHSISAFCNAGFALFSDSLMQFSDTLSIPLIVSLLIVLGGLGFGLLYGLSQVLRRGRPNAMHLKIVLFSTVALLLIGTIGLWLLERPRAFADMSFGESLMHAWFQSVTTRTAGFNTVDISRMGTVSHGLMMALMFIGAAPGSTAGGIKVTTFVVLLLVIRAVIRGRDSVTYSGRRIENTTVMNATALVCLAFFVLTAISALLLQTQALPADMLLFEAVSAFGTVGLSLGATAHLSTVGKLGIIVLMFFGRVGPLTLLILMRPAATPRRTFPSANVMIG
jgi:trk system potassium uptake protein TrkH